MLFIIPVLLMKLRVRQIEWCAVLIFYFCVTNYYTLFTVLQFKAVRIYFLSVSVGHDSSVARLGPLLRVCKGGSRRVRWSTGFSSRLTWLLVEFSFLPLYEILIFLLAVGWELPCAPEAIATRPLSSGPPTTWQLTSSRPAEESLTLGRAPDPL